MNTLQGNIVNANGPTAPRRARHSAESPQRVRRESAERRERSPRSVAARARTPTAPPRRGSVSAPRVRPRRWTSPGLGVALGDGPCDRALRRPTCGRTPGRGPRGIKFFAFSRQRATAPRTMPYPAATGPPTISSDLDTTTATRWLKPPYPRARRRKRSRTLATAYSDLPPSRGGSLPLTCHLSQCWPGSEKQTFP